MARWLTSASVVTTSPAPPGGSLPTPAPPTHSVPSAPVARACGTETGDAVEVTAPAVVTRSSVCAFRSATQTAAPDAAAISDSPSSGWTNSVIVPLGSTRPIVVAPRRYQTLPSAPRASSWMVVVEAGGPPYGGSGNDVPPPPVPIRKMASAVAAHMLPSEPATRSSTGPGIGYTARSPAGVRAPIAQVAKAGALYHIRPSGPAARSSTASWPDPLLATVTTW